MTIEIRGMMLAAALLLSASAGAHGVQGKKGTADAQLDRSARPAAAVVDAFHAALRRGDTATAIALLTDDALIFETGGAEHDKAEYAAEHLRADAEFSSKVVSSVTRRVGRSDGATAWIATEGRSTGAFGGKPIDQRTTETMILRRTAQGWRIAHVHWSSARAR